MTDMNEDVNYGNNNINDDDDDNNNNNNILICSTVIPRLTSDPANQFFG